MASCTQIKPSSNTGCGDGFTVMTIVIGFPLQPFKIGVMVYAAVPTVVPASRTWSMVLLPPPSSAPVTPSCTTVHVKSVPKIFGDRIIFVDSPLQIIVPPEPKTSGVGFTVTVTVIGNPTQVAAVGVMV